MYRTKLRNEPSQNALHALGAGLRLLLQLPICRLGSERAIFQELKNQLLPTPVHPEGAGKSASEEKVSEARASSSLHVILLDFAFGRRGCIFIHSVDLHSRCPCVRSRSLDHISSHAALQHPHGFC